MTTSTVVGGIAGLVCIFIASRAVAWLWFFFFGAMQARVQQKFDFVKTKPSDAQARRLIFTVYFSLLISDLIRLTVVAGVCAAFSHFFPSSPIWILFLVWVLIRSRRFRSAVAQCQRVPQTALLPEGHSRALTPWRPRSIV